ncbi:MAG: response regulator [bacterium]
MDNDESARFLLSHSLAADGHTVKLAAGGQEGLTAFKDELFDVVILDRAMPGMSGDTLAVAIKGISPGTPVIMMTGFGDILADHGGRPVGVDKIVTKPWTREALRLALTEVLAGKRHTAQADLEDEAIR